MCFNYMNKLSSKGYVPGEPVNFSFKIDNRSSRDINESRVSLIQINKFHATTKKKTESNEVALVINNKKIKNHSIEEWNGSLRIPEIISSSNGLCKIIKINYVLEFIFCPSISFYAKIKIPIGKILN